MPCSAHRACWEDCLVLLAVASEREDDGSSAGSSRERVFSVASIVDFCDKIIAYGSLSGVWRKRAGF
jgi:hypothetical protein